MRVHLAPGIGRLKEWGPSPSWPDGRGVYALRPLLGVRRATLRAWLAAEARPWLEDPSNQDLRFGRSRARAALAADPDVRPPPPEEAPGALFGLPLQEDPDGALVLERKRLRDAGSEAVRLLGVAAACASGSPAPPRRAQLDRLAARLAGPGAVIASLCGARIVASEDAVAVSREPGEHRRRPPGALTLRAGEVGVWDGRFEIAAQADLKVRPAAGSLCRLAAADRAALAPVPSDRRGALPLIVVGGRVLPPRPFGPGPAFARALSGARFAAALGAASHERDIARIFMANERQSSYVEDLALA